MPRRELSPDAEAIIDEIRAAFKGVRRGPLSLHQAAIVKYASDRDLKEAAKLDSDRSWEGIPEEAIEACGRALYGADAESWRYLIPAFMTWSLRYYRVNQSFVSDQTIYGFDPYPANKDNSLHQRDIHRYETLSPAQRQTVLHFLEHMAHDDVFADAVVARRAILNYWGQFGTPKPA